MTVVIKTERIAGLWKETAPSAVPTRNLAKKLDLSRRKTASFNPWLRALNARLYGTLPLSYDTWRMRRRIVMDPIIHSTMYRNGWDYFYDPHRTRRWGYTGVSSRAKAPLDRTNPPAVPKREISAGRRFLRRAGLIAAAGF